MKVALAIASLKSGGAERVISNLANSLADAGHDVKLYVFDNDDPFYPLRTEVKLEKIAPIRPTNPVATFLLLIMITLKLRRSLRRDGFEVLITFLTLTNIIGIIACLGTKTSAIVSERISLDHREKKFVEIGRRFLYRFARAAVFQTNRIVQSYKDHGIKLPMNVSIIPNALPPEFVTDEYQPMSSRGKIILASGRLVNQKGFDLLIQVFSTLQAKDWSLHIVGTGSDESMLKAMAGSVGNGRVHFLGTVKKMKTLYENASIFVLSSRFEGFPNVLCEAMASGCACISFDCDFGPAEIITHGETGLLVKLGDTNALAVAMEKMMSDEEVRSKVSVEAIKIREKLHPASIYEMWEDIILSVCASTTPDKSKDDR